MTMTSRASIAWFGHSHTSIEAALRSRGLAFEVATKVAPLSPGVTSAIMHYQGETAQLSKFLAHAKSQLDHGIKVFIVAKKANFGSASLAVSSFMQSSINALDVKDYEKESIAADIGTQLRVYDLDRPASKAKLGLDVPAEVANECLLYKLERPANHSLKLKTKETLNLTFQTLLKRAFSDFQTIELDDLPGGRSTIRGVWKVTGVDTNGVRYEPFVVKFGAKTRITGEIESNRAVVEDLIPFQNHPAIAYERCVFGMGERLFVSRFVDNATRLDDFLVRISPTLGITALFDRALRTWRAPINHVQDTIQIAERFHNFWAIPKKNEPDAIKVPYELAKKETLTGILTPNALLQRLYATPKVKCRVGHAHGDLHARNVFVRDNSTEVVLIDFATWHQPSPMSRDPATLDVALAFDIWDDGKTAFDVKPLSQGKLEELYSAPLLCPPRKHCESFRDQAIIRLRIEAASDCSEDEYKSAIICCLLRFARFEPKGAKDHVANVNRMRALAYQRASILCK